MSNKPNNNPGTNFSRDNDFGLRGRYATHPAPKKPSHEEESPRPESGSKPESASPETKESSRKNASPSMDAKPADAVRPNNRKAEPRSNSARTESSRASKNANKRESFEDKAEPAFSKPSDNKEKPAGMRSRSVSGTRPRSSGQTRRPSEARASSAAYSSERAQRSTERPSAARARRKEEEAAKERARQEKAESKQRAKKAKEASESTPAEYTPYGFEPSARVGLILRRAPYVFGGALAIVVICFIVSLVVGMMPIEVTVNGAPTKLSGERTVSAAFEAAGEPAKAGNLLDVTGEVLEEGGGDRFAAAVNGKKVEDPDLATLEEGDAVVFSDGADAEEPLKSEEKITVEPKDVEEGRGAIHVITQEGVEGVSVKKVGEISGKTATVVEKESEPRVYTSYQPNVGDDKVIALTFDDGPWKGTTEEILDILKENEAKATFFTVGERITDDKVDLLKRMANEGHQICTHTWDHASGSGQGVNLSYMSKAEQREEVEKGQQAIADATGQKASAVFRAPGGNFPVKVWKNVSDLVTAEIGWNIDTLDWQKPGASAIAEQIKAAEPGSIILMHDGGGNRSQTVKALREALPYLKEQGYRFITIDELLEYPIE